jgi:hypothetical protein
MASVDPSHQEQEHMQRRFGFLGVLFVGVIALIVGGLGYAAGLAAGQTGAGAATGTVVYPVGLWHPFGFGLFGILFFVLILVLLLRAIAGPRRWGGPGWGYGGRGWGPGWQGWGPGGPKGTGDSGGNAYFTYEVPPPFEPMLERWHQRAHGETPGGAPAPGSAEPPPSPGR